MKKHRKRNRTDEAVEPSKKTGALRETELVLKLKKEEMFDRYILLPHAELNSIVYTCVDGFVEKYRGDEMSLLICTDSVNPAVQNVFREVYRSHYEDELLKVNKYLKRHFIRAVLLIVISLFAFLMSSQMSKTTPEGTVISYIIGNVSCFCLWEVGYTHFSTRDAIDERKRILRALNAKIEFQ